MVRNCDKCGAGIATGGIYCTSCGDGGCTVTTCAQEQCDRGDCDHQECKSGALAWDVELMSSEVERLEQTEVVKAAVVHLRAAADLLGKIER